MFSNNYLFASGGSPGYALEDPEKGNGSSGRPVRAAVVTAAAISEAQNDILAKFDRSVNSLNSDIIILRTNVELHIAIQTFSEGGTIQSTAEPCVS